MAERRILNSWKEIANSLGRGVRTVQRWEAQLGLPVHRPAGKDHSAVLAFSSELDQWLDSRPVRFGMNLNPGESTQDRQSGQVQALLTRAEAVLQRLESILNRADETQRKLVETLDVLAESESARRELRNLKARRLEAGAA